MKSIPEMFLQILAQMLQKGFFCCSKRAGIWLNACIFEFSRIRSNIALKQMHVLLSPTCDGLHNLKEITGLSVMTLHFKHVWISISKHTLLWIQSHPFSFMWNGWKSSQIKPQKLKTRKQDVNVCMTGTYQRKTQSIKRTCMYLTLLQRLYIFMFCQISIYTH